MIFIMIFIRQEMLIVSLRQVRRDVCCNAKGLNVLLDNFTM